jgi:hypothetical protein
MVNNLKKYLWFWDKPAPFEDELRTKGRGSAPHLVGVARDEAKFDLLWCEVVRLWWEVVRLRCKRALVRP